MKESMNKAVTVSVEQEKDREDSMNKAVAVSVEQEKDREDSMNKEVAVCVDKEIYDKEMKEYRFDNELKVELDARSKNESLARIIVAAFVSQLNPTLEELGDIKTAVSEAVTNCIIHGYGSKPGKITMHCYLCKNELGIRIEDQGVGIVDLGKAMEPMYTTRPELERSGMGFAFMEAFMDSLEVHSTPNKGTTVIMKKCIQTT